MTISDEDALLLSRYIDGNLDGKESAGFKARLLSEPELLQLYEALAQNDEVLSDMVGRIESEPVPDEIETLLTESDRPNPYERWQVIAASVLVGVVVLSFLTVSDQDAELASLLDVTPSGQVVAYEAGSLEVISTFETQFGWCREFMTTSERGVACRDSDSWTVMASEPVLNGDGGGVYQPAGNDSGVQEFVLRELLGPVADREIETRLLATWGEEP